jgi:hypothetical protein
MNWNKLFDTVSEPEYSLKKLDELQQKYQITEDDMRKLEFSCRMIFACEEERR